MIKPAPTTPPIKEPITASKIEDLQIFTKEIIVFLKYLDMILFWMKIMIRFC